MRTVEKNRAKSFDSKNKFDNFEKTYPPITTILMEILHLLVIITMIWLKNTTTQTKEGSKMKRSILETQ